jgi:serine protease Do
MRRESREGREERSNSARERRVLRGMTIVSLTGLLGMGLTVGPTRAQETVGTDKTDSTLTYLTGLQDAFSKVADDVEPAVVTVLSTKAAEGEGERRLLPFGRGPRRSTGTGSGVIIRKDGWVLTNDHVVGGADKVTIRLNDGREFVGTVRRDYRSDLALVKISASTPFPAAKLGDSDKVKIGHWAIAIGSPYRYEGSFSVGVISSLNRRQEIRDFETPGRGRFYPTMLQTDAAINPGNSGGPLCNIRGEVIGINTAIESDGGGSIGIGFAIPMNSARYVIDQLLEKGKVSYGYLGVQPTTVTPRLASTLKVARGALIEIEPDPGSPAAVGGLKAGDVVTAISGKAVRNELDLRTIVAQTAPETNIEMTIVREGAEKKLKVLLKEAPELVPEKERPARKANLGIEVQPITKELARKIGIPATTPGVAIKSIEDTASANEVDGLVEGAIILKINDKETTSVKAFEEATANIKAGDKVRILFQVGRTTKFAIVEVD